MTRTTYRMMEDELRALLTRMSALSGDICGESGKSWQDIARDAAEDAGDLAMLLANASHGHHEPFLTFPSPAECMDKIEAEV